MKYYSQKQLLSVSNVNVSFPISNNEELVTFVLLSDNIQLKNVHLTETKSLGQLSLSITKYGKPMVFNITVDSISSDINIMRIEQFAERKQVTSCMFPFILCFLSLGVSIGISLRNWHKTSLQKCFKYIHNSLYPFK